MTNNLDLISQTISECYSFVGMVDGWGIFLFQVRLWRYAPLPRLRAPVPGCCWCLSRPAGASCPWCGCTGALPWWSTNTQVRGYCWGQWRQRQRGSTRSPPPMGSNYNYTLQLVFNKILQNGSSPPPLTNWINSETLYFSRCQELNCSLQIVIHMLCMLNTICL